MQPIDLVFLGAGFSRCVTNGGAPLMQGFFDRLDSGRMPELSEYLDECFSGIASTNVEKALTLLDQIVYSAKASSNPRCRHWEQQAPAIRTQLRRYCIDRFCGLNVQNDHWAVQLLASAADHATVLTTNYDNIAERILSSRVGVIHQGDNPTCHHCRMRRILMAGCGCNPRWNSTDGIWHRSLIKLHGSVSWDRCVNPNCCEVECLNPDVHCRPFVSRPCKNCGMPVEPVIVLPSMQKHLNDFPEIGRMWDAGATAIQHATSILVFGFSFPDSDAFLGMMMRQAIAENRQLRWIGVIDIDPGAVAARLQMLFPQNRSLVIQPFAVPPDGSEPTWIIDAEDSNLGTHTRTV